MNCKICTGEFANSPDSIVLCKHHTGIVHLGCCINRCSMDKKPCMNKAAIYDKLE
jgi:hypothetical protein